MSPSQPSPAPWNLPLARLFRPGIRPLGVGFLGMGLLVICVGCTSAPPKEESLDADARTQILRENAAKAEAERISRLQLEDAAPGNTNPSMGADRTSGAVPGAGNSNALGAESGATGKPSAANLRSSQNTSGAEKKKSKVEEAEELANKIEKAVRDLYLAELEGELAGEKAEHAALAAKDKLAKATVELEQAVQKLVRYRRVDGPALVGKQQLSLDKLNYRLEESRQNLDQMREEYSKFETDSVAKRTGDIVIWRAETQLDFAKREVGLAKLAENTLTKTTIPQQTAALEALVEDKKNAVRQAEEAIARLDFETKLNLSKAANSVVYKQLELDRLRAKKAGL